MFNWLYNLLGTLLYWFSSITGGSYALALLFYALLFKILFQQKNQIAMAKLTPKIELIKAKYKGRTDSVTMRKQQEEILALQQQEGYSPFSGCLPMLIQLPLIIFLYNVIRKPLSFICKLSEEAITNIYKSVHNVTEAVKFDSIDQITLIAKIEEQGIDIASFGAERVLPDFHLFGQNLALTPSLSAISLLCLIPIVAAALQWLTMFLTRKWNGNSMGAAGQDAQTQASMKIMDLVMPAMTLFFTFSFSAMMGLYWIYQSIIAIIQTFIISRAMPLPTYTEEELKAMRKAQKEAEKKQKAALKTQPKYRSLHYIDEDDYDELPELKTQTQQKPSSSGDIPEIKD